MPTPDQIIYVGCLEINIQKKTRRKLDSFRKLNGKCARCDYVFPTIMTIKIKENCPAPFQNTLSLIRELKLKCAAVL